MGAGRHNLVGRGANRFASAGSLSASSGVIGLTKTLAAEYAAKGVTVNTIHIWSWIPRCYVRPRRQNSWCPASNWRGLCRPDASVRGTDIADSQIVDRLGDSRSMVYALAGKIFVSTLIAPMPLHEFESVKREAIVSASGTADADARANLKAIIGWEEINRGRVNQARESALDLIQIGQSLNDPRCAGYGLMMMAWIALISGSYAEALEHSEHSLSVAVTVNDQISALGGKAFALVLLRRIEEGEALLEEYRTRCRADGNLFSLSASEPMLGICKIFRGKIAAGVHVIEGAILKEEKEGYRTRADWHRLNLAEVYLQIMAGNQKTSIAIILKNLPTLLRIMVIGVSRIRALITRVMENPHFDPAGFHVGRSKMILGLLYKAKKKRALAVEHLTEARRILSQFGETPILARVETALVELGQ